jgi:HAD superfamily hydrolase (TIGR01509 family)
MNDEIRAVLFDMDGLMFDTEAIYARTWNAAAKEFGYKLTDDLYRQCVGKKISDCELILVRTFGKTFPLKAFMKRAWEVWYDTMQKNGAPKKPGLIELLDYLDEKRISRAVVTSSTREIAMFTLGDVAKRYDAIVTGEEVQNGKPAPDIFLLAVKRLKVAPEDCLVLEDSNAGMQAAHRAGMRAIMIPDLIPPTDETLQTAFRVVETLFDVKELLQSTLL